MYRAGRLTIQGRDCAIDVGEIGDGFPVLIGQVPLELLDWVVDLSNIRKRSQVLDFTGLHPFSDSYSGQRLIGNPEHGGAHIMEIFWPNAESSLDRDCDPKPEINSP